MMPLISIIIPIYNRRHVIGETLDSVLGQVYQNWECIIVDDGSIDGTISVLESYCKKDTRIRYYRRPQDKLPGGNAARNMGVALSNGEYLMFLDSDDLLSKHCLDTRSKLFNENLECSFLVFKMGAFSEGRFIDNKLAINANIIDNLKDFLSQNYPWNITGPIWKKSFFIDKLYFDERLTRYQDIDLHIRALLECKEAYKVISITDCYYRRDKESLKRFLESNFKREIVKSYYYLICNVIKLTPDSILVKVEKEMKFGFYRLISKFADYNNLHIIKNTYILLSKEINLSFKERLYFRFLGLLSIYYKRKRGYYVLRRPIINYFENQLQTK